MKYLAWLTVALNLIGALLVAYNYRIIGYSCFATGAVSFVFIESRNGNYPQVALNAAYLFINLIGLYHAL